MARPVVEPPAFGRPMIQHGICIARIARHISELREADVERGLDPAAAYFGIPPVRSGGYVIERVHVAQLPIGDLAPGSQNRSVQRLYRLAVGWHSAAGRTDQRDRDNPHKQPDIAQLHR